MRNPHSLETKAKISASMKGRQPSPQNRIALLAANTGRPCGLETRAKIGAALKGKPKSFEHRHKISLSQCGNQNASGSRSLQSKKKMSRAQRGNTKALGHRVSLEARERIRRASFKALDNHSDPCSCWRHGRGPSWLAWRVYDLLFRDFEIVIPEERFGPYSVDFLLAEEWLAIEIDGEYWHKNRKQQDAAKDRWLLENFDLPVTRLEFRKLRSLK